jgi:hypothetical protein
MSFWGQFTEEELRIVDTFRNAIERISDAEFSDDETRPSLHIVAQSVGIQIRDFPKDGIILQALWVLYLTKLKALTPDHALKYPTFESFFAAYRAILTTSSNEELNLLWHTANWMSRLFTMIPAYKNKGLAIMVVPKLIEGWDAKYITGSGQKEVTRNRVTIYETEGNTKPNYRGKLNHKPKSSPSPRSKVPKRTYRKKDSQAMLKTQETIRSRRGLRQHQHEYGLTDDENESVDTAGDHLENLVSPSPIIPLKRATTKELIEDFMEENDDFDAALNLFRDTSAGKLSLFRANSLSLPPGTCGETIDFEADLFEHANV